MGGRERPFEKLMGRVIEPCAWWELKGPVRRREAHELWQSWELTLIRRQELFEMELGYRVVAYMV